MEDRIALALVDFKGINQNNIVDAIRQLELRDVKVDRCSTYDDVLSFRDLGEGTDTRYKAGKFNWSPNAIPNFMEFHTQASKYLRRVTLVMPSAEHSGRKTKTQLIEATLAKTDSRLVFTLGEHYDPPAFGFELPSGGFLSLDDFLSENVADRSMAIALQGPSEWTLNELRQRLQIAGCNTIAIGHTPVRPTLHQKASNFARQLGSEIFTLSNISNFFWGIAGLVTGFIFRQLTL